ncbi:MAG: hypothetical protein Q8O42_14960 [Acidobacteriota bacterium]|nr:hypothetical protein [Acidobacteriota bacterium]
MDVLDAEVLATLQDDVCRPAVIEEAIRLALEALAPARQDSNREHLAAELATVRHECERLAEAIGRGGPLDALLGRLTDRQGRATAIEQELSLMRAERPLVTLDGLESRLRAKLADWRGLLTRNVAEGRAVLRALLIGPLRFTPIDDGRRRGYAFSGAISLDRLLAGVVELPTMVASPRGFEPVFLRRVPTPDKSRLPGEPRCTCPRAGPVRSLQPRRTAPSRRPRGASGRPRSLAS